MRRVAVVSLVALLSVAASRTCWTGADSQGRGPGLSEQLMASDLIVVGEVTLLRVKHSLVEERGKKILSFGTFNTSQGEVQFVADVRIAQIIASAWAEDAMKARGIGDNGTLSVVLRVTRDGQASDPDPVLESHGEYLLFLREWPGTERDAGELQVSALSVFSCYNGWKGAFLLSDPSAIRTAAGREYYAAHQKRFLTTCFGSDVTASLVAATEKLVRALSDKVRTPERLLDLTREPDVVASRIARDLLTARAVCPRASAPRDKPKQKEGTTPDQR